MKFFGLILLSLISVSCNKSGGDATTKQPEEKHVEEVKDLPTVGEIIHATIRDTAGGSANCESTLFFSNYLKSKNSYFMLYARKTVLSQSNYIRLFKNLGEEFENQDLSQIDESILKDMVFDSNDVQVKEGDILIGTIRANYDADFALKILGETDGCLDIEYKLLKFRYN